MAKPKDVWQTAMARQQLRPADDTAIGQLARTLDALDLSDADRAIVQLAKSYAAALDADHCAECGQHRSLDVLGPKYEAVLDVLIATPAARAKLTKGAAGHTQPNRLQALREARHA